ncbi:hypothetical protein N658DRAFT_480341 [Parathielavia hyrcaniae]|uniref:Uncharacterized protein n=1 Tax=Parathielavia hyrcaniae TaxID=113614 RepID=A0AAN6PRV1_9PEZI|nr:hypothetical protein N658DRAFT_480341 [Parathielavia hyrcaniae]
MRGWDVSDTCNKSVAVYILTQPGDNRRSGLLRMVLHNYIYRRWFRPYRSDIEHQRSICKFILPKDLPEHDNMEPSGSPPESAITTLVAMNKAICAEADTRRRVYAERLAAGDEMVSGESLISGIGDLRCHLIQALFRALLVIVNYRYYETDDDSTTVGRMPLFLVHTGIQDGLSAPISFSSIADKIDGYKGEAQAVVKTTLETAVDFIMGLEQRELGAFWLQPPFPTSGMMIAEARVQPWGDEPLTGPSSRLVNTEEYPQWSGKGEDVDRRMMTGWERHARRRFEAAYM